MSISVAFRHKLGSFLLDVDFQSSGRLTAIFGASGSGKTSVINVMAGLIRPDAGKVTIDGHVLADSDRGVFLPAHRRRIGYVFQDARLFPHLTVAQNLAYGRWFAPRQERYADRDQIITLLGISHLLARRPDQLSGGEKQRAAIGRALLASPRLLLMDEPLASLDLSRKAEILPYIERLRDEFRIPIVYVSHSVAEVMRLATDIVVLDQGRVAASGPTAQIARRLDLVPPDEHDEGGVVLDMTVVSHDPAYGMTLLRAAAGDAHVQGQAGPAGAQARVRIRARDVMIATQRPRHISALNIFEGEIVTMNSTAPTTLDVTLDCRGTPVIARITRQSADALGLAIGRPVFAVMKAVSITSSGAAQPPPEESSRSSAAR